MTACNTPFGVAAPVSAKVSHSPIQDRPGLCIHKELWQVISRHPVGTAVHEIAHLRPGRRHLSPSCDANGHAGL